MYNDKIIHVRLLEPGDLPADQYFGSLAAIYDFIPAEALGIRYSSLLTTFARQGYRYENDKCVITAGVLHRKKWSKNKKQE